MSHVQLLTPDLKHQLRANGRNASADHLPLVKLFNPVGAATWLLTEMDDTGDRLFGLGDLGLGFPELGYFSLAELQSVRLPFGLWIEREASFRTSHPISVWAQHARTAGSISEAERLLRSLSYEACGSHAAGR
jgi:hypothetical protein